MESRVLIKINKVMINAEISNKKEHQKPSWADKEHMCWILPVNSFWASTASKNLVHNAITLLLKNQENMYTYVL